MRPMLLPLAVLALPATAIGQRDSLGITIVESGTIGPRVTAAEALRLGTADGSPEETFYRVRDVQLGPDGSVVVLEEGDGTIKVFSPSGRLQVMFGGIGEGPREFRTPWLLELTGDTVSVLDIGLRRVVRFRLDGTLIASRRLDFFVHAHGWPEAFTTLADGRVAIAGTRGCGFPRQPTDNEWGLFVFGEFGESVDTVLLDRSGDALPVYAGGAGGGACTVVAWPFGATPVVALEAAGAVWSPGNRFEMQRRGTDLRRVEAVFRYPVQPRRVTTTDRRAFQGVMDEREMDRDLRDAAAAAIDSAGYPETWPAIAALRIAGPRAIWARRAHGPGAVMQEWDVLVEGRHARTVLLPASVSVTAVRGDLIAGVVTDDLGVEYVVVLTTRDPPTRPPARSRSGR